MGDSAGYSVIRLHRRRGFYRDSLRAYRVRIDGNPLGKIAKGETRDFIVPPGEHRIRLTIDQLWGSREVMLQARASELVEFTCRPGSMLWILFAPLCTASLPLLVSPLWVLGLFALVGGGFGLLLVRYRHIRLDGPTVTSRA